MRASVLFGSTAAHVLVLCWIAVEAAEPGRPRRQAAVQQPGRVNEPTAIPIELAFVVEAAAANAQATGSTRSGSQRIGIRRAASAAPAASDAGDAATPSSSSPSSSSASSLMRMRGSDLGIHPDLELRRSGKLESQPGGRAVVRDTVTTMSVDADGSVTFADKPTLDVKARAPMSAVLDPEFRREVKQHVAKWLEDPYEGTRYRPSQDLPRHLQAVPGACDTWGSDFCQDPLAPAFETRLRAIKAKLRGGISGTLDLTDLVMRKRGGDPYASRKLKLLDDTRDERALMGERHRAEQLARSGELVRRNLERLWAEELDPTARRVALFELWDECGEDDAGMRARAFVIGWIRTRLPRGSEHAFTDAEIAALRAHSTSTQDFVPYE